MMKLYSIKGVLFLMNVFRKFVFPALTGFVSAPVSAALSLLLFVYLPGSVQRAFDMDSIALPVMMTLSAFLLYAALMYSMKYRSVITRDDQEEKPAVFTALFLAGSALAAVWAMLFAFAFDWSGAATLVMICYMIICDLVVILAFTLVLMIVRWLLSRMGKNNGFLDTLKWRLPLSLLFFAVVFAALLLF